MKLGNPSEALFLTTARIVVDDTYVGTAAFVDFEAGEERRSFLVTVRHLVEGSRFGSIFFLPHQNGEPTFEAPIEYHIERFGEMWWYHSDKAVDIAVLPLEPIDRELSTSGHDVIACPIRSQDFMQDWEDAPHPVLEILRTPQPLEEVLFIGYPNNYFDRTNGLPIARKGITASLLSVPYEQKPVFLLDATVVEGSSGSPVFYINDERGRLDRSVKFLGVLSDILPPKSVNWTPPAQHAPSAEARINLGAVYRASAVAEAIRQYVAVVGPATPAAN